jgi:hypothetical protein
VRSFRLLARLRRGDLPNVRFADFCRLIEKAGPVFVRAEESHRIYRHQAAPVLLNLQDADGMAQPSQVRQFLLTMKRCALTLGDGK